MSSAQTAPFWKKATRLMLISAAVGILYYGLRAGVNYLLLLFQIDNEKIHVWFWLIDILPIIAFVSLVVSLVLRRFAWGLAFVMLLTVWLSFEALRSFYPTAAFCRHVTTNKDDALDVAIEFISKQDYLNRLELLPVDQLKLYRVEAEKCCYVFRKGGIQSFNKAYWDIIMFLPQKNGKRIEFSMQVSECGELISYIGSTSD